MEMVAKGTIRRRRLVHLSQLRDRVLILTDINFKILSAHSPVRLIQLRYRPTLVVGCRLLRDCVRLGDRTAIQTLLLCGSKRNLLVSLPVNRSAEAVEVSMLRLFHDEKLPMLKAIESANEIAATLQGISPMLHMRVDHSLKVILTGCNRLLCTINSVSDSASGVLDGRFMQCRRVDLVQHVRTICIGMMAMALEGGIKLSYRSNALQLDAMLDPEFITRIVENLLSNAIRHTPAGGQIWVRVDQVSDARLQLSVSDNGPGVPEEIKSRVFERFVTGWSAPHPGAGMGLGLYNVRMLTEKMGGAVRCVSKPGQGARFEVDLPVTAMAELEVCEGTNADAMQPSPTGVCPRRGKARAL